MASNQEKKVLGFLYGEISRLKKQIWDMAEEHQTELCMWTRKCGQLGNEVGNLRKELMAQEREHQAALTLWTRKCGTLGNELGQLRKQLMKKECEIEAERPATLNSWIKKCGEVVNEIDRLRTELLNKEIAYQTDREQSKHEIDVLRQRCEQLEIEHQTDILKQRIDSDLTKLIDREADATVVIDHADIHERSSAGQINDVEADRIVKTYYSSDGETDEVNHVSESAGIDDHTITENVLPSNVTDHQEEADELVKQKPKFPFWKTLKRHVSIRGKMGKSSTLTYKVSGTDGEQSSAV